MASNTSSNLVHPVGNVATQKVAVSYRAIAFLASSSIHGVAPEQMTHPLER